MDFLVLTTFRWYGKLCLASPIGIMLTAAILGDDVKLKRHIMVGLHVFGVIPLFILFMSLLNPSAFTCFIGFMSN